MDSINVMQMIIPSNLHMSFSFPMVIDETNNDRSFSSASCVFVPLAARSIDRHWTELTEFHENLLTICRPMYFTDGFNEQFIELIDAKQTVRYNRSALLVKHIRSTTHLLCKLFIDTTSVGIRVQTLIKQSMDILCRKYDFIHQ